MEKKVILLINFFVIILFFSCKNLTEINTIEKSNISAPSEKTVFYLSTDGFPGWQIMSYNDGEIYRLSTGPFDVSLNVSENKEEIIYSRGIPNSGTNALQIWKMKFNGEGKIPLTQSGIDCQQPAFSSDGNRISFSAEINSDTGERHLIIMNSDGTGWKQITSSSTIPYLKPIYFGHSCWFNESEKIIVHVAGFNKSQNLIHMIGIINLVDNKFTPIPNISYLSPWQPNLSNSDEKIAFVSGADGGGSDIYVINLDGNNLKKLTDSKFCKEPDWFFNDEKIIYIKRNERTETEEIRVINLDTSNDHVLIKSREGVSLGRPRW